MEEIGSFIIMFMNALCMLVFFASIYSIHRKEGRLSFDVFQNLTMTIYVVLIFSQTAEALVGWKLITDYKDPRIQIFETVQSSLFFLFVDSIWYRMKALREGDKYFVVTLVKEARTRMFKEFLGFLFGYTVMTVIVTMTDFFEKDDD